MNYKNIEYTRKYNAVFTGRVHHYFWLYLTVHGQPPQAGDGGVSFIRLNVVCGTCS
jgi:hypothetical protein